MHNYHGFLGFIVLILNIWAWVSIIQSDRSFIVKLLWFVLVLILPVLGFVIWLLAGPRANNS